MTERRTPIVVGFAVLLMIFALPAGSAPLGPPDASDPPTSHPLTDSDDDNISDGLESALEDAAPSDRIDVIVTFIDRASASAAEKTVPTQAIRHRFDLIPGFSAGLNKGQINGLSNHPGVIRVEETFQITALNNSANADFGTELARVDWAVEGTGVGICIADTGIDPGHEQLDDVGKIVDWADFVGSSSSPNDGHGHGTHVAATAAGSGTGGADASKYHGVAPGAVLYGAKVLDNNGFSVGTSVQQGIEWCAEQPGVDIISMSLGTTAGSDGQDSLSQAANAAVDAGKIVVVAAGNSGEAPQTVGSPGAAEKVITVGAVAEHSVPPGSAQSSDGIHIATFSSRGPTLGVPRIKPDIASPGVTIVSADAGTSSGYVTFSGTSMATPFTSGTIALMLDADSTISDARVKSLIQSTSHDWGPPGKDNHYGWGLIDGYALVAEASGAASYPITPLPRYTVMSGSVPDGGVTTHTFEIGPGDLSTPIAATVIINGSLECAAWFFGICLGWEWDPDLEARIKDPNGTVQQISECPLTGDCGNPGSGQTETLHLRPSIAGTWTIEIYPVGGTGPGGSYSIYLSTGPVGTPDATPPSAPASLSAIPSGLAADLIWGAASDPDSGVSSYRVFRADGAGGPMALLTEVDGSRTTYRDTAVQSARTYDYEIKAVNGSGLVGPSSPTASAPTGPDDGSQLGWWALDDGSGTTALDFAPPDSHGTLVNGPVWIADGEIGGALGFDGNDDYIDLDPSALDGVGDMTVSLWFRTLKNGVQGFVSLAEPSNDNEFLLAPISATNIRFYTGETFETFVSWDVPAFNNGLWHHLAVTRGDTSDQATLYLDGVDYGSKSATFNPITASSGVLLVGQEQDAPGGMLDPTQAFQGDMDEIRFYDRVLSPSEITDLAGLPDTTPPGAPTGLTATPGDGQVSLDWDDNPEPDVAAYSVLRAEVTSGPYTEVVSGLSDSTYTDSGVTNGATYYYVVTAVDTFANESDFSGEALATPQAPPPSGPIDFRTTPIQSYGAGQDASGVAEVLDSGATLRITGNGWKKIALPYTVTPNTVIEFDFTSSAEGEIQGIGFDTNDAISPESTFQVFGTQTWGIQAYHNYTSPGTTHYVIQAGALITAGDYTHLIFANDHDIPTPTAESVFTNVQIYEQTPPGPGPIDFRTTPIQSYGAGQDASGVAEVLDSGATLRITGNGWKKIALPYTVTPNTVIEFDFTSSAEGEIQGIGFDTNDAISPESTFQVFGTQTWGIQAYHNYTSPGTTHYVIQAGALITAGDYTHLIFANDHDIPTPTAESVFTNVQIYEQTPPGPGPIDFRTTPIQSYGAGQDASGVAEVLDSGATLRITGNGWKKIALPYTVTPNTVIEFDFTSSAEGEIQGIGFDTNDAISPESTFQVFGTQTWGIQAYHNYTSPGTTHYVIQAGALITAGDYTHLIFANDHDIPTPTAESVFTNVQIYEQTP